MGAKASTARASKACNPKPAEDAKGSSVKKKGDFLEKYVFGKRLGEGAFACVFACRPRSRSPDSSTSSSINMANSDRSSKESYYLAAKLIDKMQSSSHQIRQEADFLMKLDHPNIVKCHEFFEAPGAEFAVLILDRQRGGDLMTCMLSQWDKLERIPVTSYRHLCSQLVASMHYLHKLDIMHRDIKCDNYLSDRADILDTKCRLMLADFGAAVKCGPKKRLTEECGTKHYWSPETWRRNYGLKADVWSMGVIHYGLMCGKFPYKDQKAIENRKLRCPVDTPKEYENYLFSMLEKVEEKRATAADLVTCEWIREPDHLCKHDWMESTYV